ncbi:hypothetical protein [Sporosarcina sp. FSL K6-3457]|uniref:hypothetical protein n=1 Tax=Sporosarcina sp. FSL K6-3457 TaxID=2978204 RepID=UPI0030F75EAC
MDKNEVVLQLTLKLLDKFDYKIEDYGGTPLKEHAEISSKIASQIFNAIHDEILKDE